MFFSALSYKNPANVRSRISNSFGYQCFEAFCSPAVMGFLPIGRARLGVRWKTVRDPARGPHSWLIWTPDAPVPMTAQRLPRTSMCSSGQKEEW